MLVKLEPPPGAIAMRCSWCEKPMREDETGIMCVRCDEGGHARCYVMTQHRKQQKHRLLSAFDNVGM
jgi:hypothetical protein